MTYHKANLLEIILFVLLISGPPSLRQRDLNASLRGELDLSTGIQVLVWLAALAWVVYVILKRRGRVPPLALPQALGISLATSLMVSAISSPAAAFTIFRGLQVLIGVLFTWFWVSRFGTDYSIRLLFFSLSLLVLLIYSSFLISPDFIVQGDSFGSRIKADLITPAAPVAMLLLALIIASPIKLNAWLVTPLGILALGLMILARNRTAFLALGLLASLSVFTLGRKWSPFVKLGVIGAIGVVSLLITINFDQILTWVVRNPTQISTFSERIPLWSYLITDTLEKSPVIGLGYAAASRVLGPQAIRGLGNAHSTFVEVFVGGGFIALACYLTIWAWVFYRSLISLGHWSRSVYAYVNLLAVIFLFSLTTSFGIYVTVTSFAFWLVLGMWTHDLSLQALGTNRVSPRPDVLQPDSGPLQAQES